MTSFGAKIFTLALQIRKIKKRIIGIDTNPPRSKKGFVPSRITNLYKTDIQSLHNKTVVTFEKKEEVNQNHVVFCHGGSYIYEIFSYHWKTVEKIVNLTSCRMTVLDYPLAPEYTYKDTFEMLEKSYKMLVKKYPKDQFILMGDSAGGGLAFAFSQKLIKENYFKLPVKIVLLSPWLDITMTSPEIKKLEKLDHMLNIQALKNAANKYAGGDDPNQYLLSPINGEMNDLPKTIVFYGTHELFYADCNKLKLITMGINDNFIYKPYKNMQHDWAVIPIPEGTKAIKEICAFLNN